MSEKGSHDWTAQARRILAVSTDPRISSELAKAISQRKLKVTVAESLESAVVWLAKEPFDLVAVVLDLQLDAIEDFVAQVREKYRRTGCVLLNAGVPLNGRSFDCAVMNTSPETGRLVALLEVVTAPRKPAVVAPKEVHKENERPSSGHQ